MTYLPILLILSIATNTIHDNKWANSECWFGMNVVVLNHCDDDDHMEPVVFYHL